ncbi:serine/threonine-protein kinase 3-like isoform X2 [Apteryx rowi]|uniref:serine/threonine-protein kinase 3-like isoform X2 n=1 Tax=Apteryx rowi TaxID=308060 RepID=UPI000E1CEF7A|nr:serine/threonine-protein kinase 3-like isoform X2 [Apteryx rowi]
MEQAAPKSKLKKLSEDSLTKQPEEVFDVLEKLGEGSYGSVFKAIHKESGQVVAIKQVPVESDLQEIIKEISIMQQCDSPYVVKYYGSYFKNTDLWIVMEYCGAGSVSDIIRLRNKTLSSSHLSPSRCVRGSVFSCCQDPGGAVAAVQYRCRAPRVECHGFLLICSSTKKS